MGRRAVGPDASMSDSCPEDGSSGTQMACLAYPEVSRAQVSVEKEDRGHAPLESMGCRCRGGMELEVHSAATDRVRRVPYP